MNNLLGNAQTFFKRRWGKKTDKCIGKIVPDKGFIPNKNYVSKDQKYTYSLIGNSVHIRANTGMKGYGVYGYAVQYAPVATGTVHAYK